MKSDLHGLCERLLDNLKEQRAVEEQQQEALAKVMFEGGDDSALFEAYQALNAANSTLSRLRTEEENLKRDIDTLEGPFRRE